MKPMLLTESTDESSVGVSFLKRVYLIWESFSYGILLFTAV